MLGRWFCALDPLSCSFGSRQEQQIRLSVVQKRLLRAVHFAGSRKRTVWTSSVSSSLHLSFSLPRGACPADVVSSSPTDDQDRTFHRVDRSASVATGRVRNICWRFGFLCHWWPGRSFEVGVGWPFVPIACSSSQRPQREPLETETAVKKASGLEKASEPR